MGGSKRFLECWYGKLGGVEAQERVGPECTWHARRLLE
jgi:hypothetical protein